MKHKKLLLWVLLAILLLILCGCGVDHNGVDVNTTPPQGLWQTLAVWPLAKALLWLDGWLQTFGLTYHWGWAIILFTVIIKVITFPLTITQMRGMQAQKDLQPKIQELQKKYGKDREKLSQEQMKLYKEAGVNPMSGCLPLVIQMPILFGLYSAIIAIGPQLANASFYWIPDLGLPSYSQGMSWIQEAYNKGDWHTLIVYMILPVLLMVSQFVMQKWMTPTMPTTGDDSNNPMGGMSKQLTFLMTFMFGFFTLQVPSGLTLYWVTSNALQMLQQWAITNNHWGLGSKPGPKLAVATATAGSASVAALPEPKKSDTNGTATKNAAIATSVPNDGSGNSNNGDTNSSDPAKEARRRRAKRR